MNRGHVLILLSCLIFAPKLWGQNSPLSNGKWAKLAVGKQGIFQLSGAQLKSMGFSIPCVSGQIQLYHFNLGNLQEKVVSNLPEGLVENALELNDGGDGQFDELDYFLFYSEGPILWKFNETDSLADHFNKSAKDSVYFFLTQGANGKRITTEIAPTTYHKTIEQFDERWLIEKDTLSLLNSGQLWLGNAMGQGMGKQLKLTYTLNMEGVVVEEPIQFKANFAAASFSGPGNFTLKLNDQAVYTASINPVSGYVYDETALVKEFQFNYLSNVPLTNAVNLAVDFTSAATNSTGWIDYIQVHAKRKLGFFGNRSFSFRNSSLANAGLPVLYKLQGADATTLVWDVSRPSNPVKMQVTIQAGALGTFVHLSDTLNEFFALQQSAFEQPTLLGKINNQNIVATPNADYLIITPAAYTKAALKLQAFHETVNNFKVSVLQAEEIYNEFSGGQISPIGIRNCIKYLMQKALQSNSNPPKYLLLLGIGNFDLRKLKVDSQIPTYQSVVSTGLLSSYTSDDFYGFLANNADINTVNSPSQLLLSIGRLPVRNLAEADTVVEKIIQYQLNSDSGAWKNQLTWVADDGDFNLHLQDAEDITQNLQRKIMQWNHKKLYLDLYKAAPTTSGNTYPALVTDLSQIMNNGSLVLNYTGHGNYLILSEEAVIAEAGMTQWDNKGRLPLMITASCDFAPYDQPQFSPIGFDALMKNSKGVAGIVAASRLVFAFSNKQLNDLFIQELLVPDSMGNYKRIGDALRQAKNNYWAMVPDRVNAFKFSLLGDPAMQLAAPKYQVQVKTINNKQFIDTDTLMAGGIHKLTGTIIGKNQIKTDYNGEVELVLYDAVKNINTLANLPTSMSVPIPVQENILFKGKATVSNGIFSIGFVLPKESVGTNGALKMQLYASGVSGDAIGVFNNIYVGNKLDAILSDTIGPIINSFINDTNFVNGTWVTGNAKLLVQLSDSAGIQISGNALGHDLVMIVDGDYKRPIVLNNYYTAAINTYQRGTVVYTLPLFQEGKHEIIIKAWDLFGNSSADTLVFVVPPTEKLMLRKFSISPNPIQTKARFSFEHNLQNKPLGVQLEIFDISGNKLAVIPVESVFNTNRVLVDWDVTASNGAALLPGIYFCRLIATDSKATVFLSSKFVKY